jgi:hypothetical protein
MPSYGKEDSSGLLFWAGWGRELERENFLDPVLLENSQRLRLLLGCTDGSQPTHL